MEKLGTNIPTPRTKQLECKLTYQVLLGMKENLDATPPYEISNILENERRKQDCILDQLLATKWADPPFGWCGTSP